MIWGLTRIRGRRGSKARWGWPQRQRLATAVGTVGDGTTAMGMRVP
jgi:hypothetical protein